jgi:DNA (cytosine-5)-methyltransferase 1
MNFIDVFAGAGGLSEGFIRAGFEPVAHIEIEEAACNTLRTRQAYHHLKHTDNFNIYIDYLKGKITRSKLYDSIPKSDRERIINLAIGEQNNNLIFTKIDELLGGDDVDLIVGGPPCQAYSLVGRARSADGMESDSRNYLYIEYAKYLERYNPRMFIFENVLGLKSAKDGYYLNSMQELFHRKGYNMKLYTVNANKFGVLQNRRRVIIIGWRQELNPDLPNLESLDFSVNATVSRIFSDLPKLSDGEGMDKNAKYRTKKPNRYLLNSHIRNGLNILTQHVTRPHTKQDKEIYKKAVRKWNKKGERLNYNDLPDYLKTHKNRTSFSDRFKIVASNERYSQTVVAHIAKDGHYYIHPDLKQNRSISIREAARLQSFPDDYYFEGVKEDINRTSAFTQIGNAVPPLMAERMAEIVYAALQ